MGGPITEMRSMRSLKTIGPRANVSSTSNRTTLCKNPLILSLTAWCPFAGSRRSDIR